jgi:hypothetical protein
MAGKEQCLERQVASCAPPAGQAYDLEGVNREARGDAGTQSMNPFRRLWLIGLSPYFSREEVDVYGQSLKEVRPSTAGAW